MDQITLFIDKLKNDEELRNRIQKLAADGKSLEDMLSDIIVIAKENGCEFDIEQCNEYIARIQDESQKGTKLSFADFAVASEDRKSWPPSAVIEGYQCVCG